MSVFGGLEDNAPDGSIFNDPGAAWQDDQPPSQEVDPIMPPHVPDVDSAASLYATENTVDTASPQLAPSTSLTQSNDDSIENAPKKRRKRLNVKITQVEITKTDLILWLDVESSLPRFRSTYRDVRRTYQEVRRFANHLVLANPECFVPALPASKTSYQPNRPEYGEKLKKDLQKWFDRVTRSPLLTRDQEFLHFVEASTGFVPAVSKKAPATGLARKVLKQLKPPPDDVEELKEFRPRAKLLYQYSEELKQKLDRVSHIRKNLGSEIKEFGAQVRDLQDPPQLATMWNRIARASLVTGDTELKKAEAEDVNIGDTMESIGREGYMIKEALTNRHFLMKDLLKSQQATQECHMKATRLKGASNISEAKVEDAITQLEMAAQLERRITTAVRRVSDNLVAEKHLALARIESDILEAIGNYTLQFIDQDRRVLAAWEHARPEVRAADPHHTGGLSNLGRDPSSPRRMKHAQSKSGDDWSDRGSRARDIAISVPEERSAEVLDAKAAASILTSELTYH